MAILALVLTTRDMNPEIKVIAGFDDGLIEVGVLDDPFEPAVEDVLVGMGFANVPLGVRCLGNLDVGNFTEGVLRGIDSSDFDVEIIAAEAGTDDYRLTCKGSERFEDLFT